MRRQKRALLLWVWFCRSERWLSPVLVLLFWYCVPHTNVGEEGEKQKGSTAGERSSGREAGAEKRIRSGRTRSERRSEIWGTKWRPVWLLETEIWGLVIDRAADEPEQRTTALRR